jgi:hypothetical protein
MEMRRQIRRDGTLPLYNTACGPLLDFQVRGRLKARRMHDRNVGISDEIVEVESKDSVYSVNHHRCNDSRIVHLDARYPMR